MLSKSFIVFTVFGLTFAGPIEKRNIQTFQNAFNTVSKSVQSLDKSIHTLTGKPNDSDLLLKAANQVETALQRSTQSIQNSVPLTLAEASQVEPLANNLASLFQTTINDLVAKQSDIAQDPDGLSATLNLLNGQQSSSILFISTLASKVPNSAADVVANQKTAINRVFNQAIQRFSAAEQPDGPAEEPPLNGPAAGPPPPANPKPAPAPGTATPLPPKSGPAPAGTQPAGAAPAPLAPAPAPANQPASAANPPAPAPAPANQPASAANPPASQPQAAQPQSGQSQSSQSQSGQSQSGQSQPAQSPSSQSQSGSAQTNQAPTQSSNLKPLPPAPAKQAHKGVGLRTAHLVEGV